MDFKKVVCTVLAALTAACVFTACGGDSNSDSAASNSAVQSNDNADNEKADVSATADKLKSDIEFEDELVEFDSAKIEKILGISADKYKSAKVYVSSSGGTPEEIDCFEAVDESAAADIKAALETRVDNQKNTFTDYRPEQAPKLDSPVIKVNGNCVYMCISGDNSKAEEIIG